MASPFRWSADIIMRTALITGVGGFLGGYIARELAAEKWRVTGIARRSIPESRVHELGLSDLTIMPLPCSDLERCLARIRPEVIVHAAGPASVIRSVEDPATDFHDSVGGLQCVLDAMRRAGSSMRLVFLSSAAVYGNPPILPVREEAILDPVSPYGFHKLMGETLVTEYARVFGVRGCCVRIFSAYGPGLKRQVMWDICHRINLDRRVALFGTGEETRDFVHAADVGRGIRAVIEGGAFEAEVYNLASGRQTGVAELARMLADALERDTEFVFTGQARPGNPIHWHADISRLGALGYRPRFSIRDGVAEYARWAVPALLAV